MKRLFFSLLILSFFLVGYFHGTGTKMDLSTGPGQSGGVAPSPYSPYNVTDNGGEAYRVTDGGGEDYNVL